MSILTALDKRLFGLHCWLVLCNRGICTRTKKTGLYKCDINFADVLQIICQYNYIVAACNRLHQLRFLSVISYQFTSVN